MRYWTFSGRNRKTGLTKLGNVQAPTKEEALKLLTPILEEGTIELEDCGPIIYFTLNPDKDAFVKASSEAYEAAKERGEATLESTPGQFGRVWNLSLPKATPQLLYQVHQLMQGEEENQSPDVVHLMHLPIQSPASIQTGPSAILARIQALPRSRESAKGYNRLDSRELMELFDSQQRFLLMWLELLTTSNSQHTSELTKEFKLFSRDYRNLFSAIIHLATQNLTANLPKSLDSTDLIKSFPVSDPIASEQSNDKDTDKGIPVDP
jgi:hypothetical protein